MPAKKKQVKSKKRKAAPRATNHASNKVNIRVISGGGGAGGGGAGGGGGMASAPPMSYMQPQQFVPMHVNTPAPFQAIGHALNVPAQPVAAGQALPANAATPARQSPLRVPLTVGPIADDDNVSVLSGGSSMFSRMSEQSHNPSGLLNGLRRQRARSPNQLIGRGYNDDTVAGESAKRSQSLHDQISSIGRQHGSSVGAISGGSYKTSSVGATSGASNTRYQSDHNSEFTANRSYSSYAPTDSSTETGSSRQLASVMGGPRKPKRPAMTDRTLESFQQYWLNTPKERQIPEFTYNKSGAIDRRSNPYREYDGRSSRQQAKKFFFGQM